MASDGSDVAHGPRTRPFVALTFHGAGDPAIAGALLGELERAGVAATVLAVGAMLLGYGGLALLENFVTFDVVEWVTNKENIVTISFGVGVLVGVAAA